MLRLARRWRTGLLVAGTLGLMAIPAKAHAQASRPFVLFSMNNGYLCVRPEVDENFPWVDGRLTVQVYCNIHEATQQWQLVSLVAEC